MRLELIEQITARLAKTFTQLNNVIRQQIQRKQIKDQPNIEPSPPQQSKSIHIHQQENDEEVPHSHQIEKDLLENDPKNDNKKDSKSDKTKIKKTSTQTRPKKPQTAFKLFQQEMKKKLQNQDAENITKMLSKEWNSLKKQEKQKYLKEEQEEKQKYQQNLQSFYQRNPSEKAKDCTKQEKKEEKKKEKTNKTQKDKEKDKEKVKTKKKQSKQLQSDYTPNKSTIIKPEENNQKQEGIQNLQQQPNNKEKNQIDQGERNCVEDRANSKQIDQFLDLGDNGGESDSLGV